MKQENVLAYEEFVEAVAVEVEQRLQQIVQVVEVAKNNDVTLIALEIMKEGINVAPIIYMTPYYKVYCEFGLEKVVEHILAVYQAYEPKENLETDVLFNKREFCSRLRMRLVHYESNQKQLQGIPYVPFLDLAITFCLLLDMQENEVGTVRITKEHMKYMEMSIEELYAIALENMETDYQFFSLYKAIEPIREEVDAEFLQIEQELYVLTTYSRVCGASLMLHKGILKKFMREKQMERIIIIPSSVHEVIVMAYDNDMEPYTIVRIPMRDLKRSQFVAHFKFLAEKKGLAEGTLRAIASMMYNCLQQVVYDSALFVNPASEIMKDVSAKAKEETEALSDEQVEMLLDFLKIEHSYQSIYLPMIGVLLGTGLRFGECVGLTWNDIDFKKKVLYVNKTLHYRCKDSSKHEFFVTTPKTVNAYRQIPLTKDLVKLFEMQKQYQMDMEIRDDIEISGHKGFVFTTKLGNPFTHEGFVAILKRIVKRANEWETQRAEEEQSEPVLLPKLKPHMFRHTFCTKLVLKEVPYKTTKTLMGHSSIKTTIDVYTHIKKEHMKKVRTDIEGIVKIF